MTSTAEHPMTQLACLITEADLATWTHAQAATLHHDNIRAITHRITTHETEPASPATTRALTNLRADLAGEHELLELLAAGEYPYPLADS